MPPLIELWPIQHNDDPLFVSVEDFKEWVIDESQMKNKDIKLKGVAYAPDLEPYIERKLFSVNTVMQRLLILVRILAIQLLGMPLRIHLY